MTPAYRDYRGSHNGKHYQSGQYCQELPFQGQKNRCTTSRSPYGEGNQRFSTGRGTNSGISCNWRSAKHHSCWSSVKELAATKNVTLTRSDKGGEIVIMPTSTLHELNIEHLSDASTYKKLAKDPTPTLRLPINKTLENTLERCGFSKSIIHRLTTPPSACTQRFYTFAKNTQGRSKPEDPSYRIGSKWHF